MLKRVVFILLLIGVSAGYFIIFGVVIGYLIFGVDPNAKLKYGDTGMPKNCRAIIKDNYEGWYLKNYSAEEALDSINRNCGESGYSWGQ
jgi:hypothetical protein